MKVEDEEKLSDSQTMTKTCHLSFILTSIANVLSAVNISIKPVLALCCALCFWPPFPAQDPGTDNTGTPSSYLLRNDTVDSRRVTQGLVLLLSDPQMENIPCQLLYNEGHTEIIFHWINAAGL